MKMSIGKFENTLVGYEVMPYINNSTAFAKAPNEWMQIERNMCGRRAAWSALGWWVWSCWCLKSLWSSLPPLFGFRAGACGKPGARLLELSVIKMFSFLVFRRCRIVKIYYNKRGSCARPANILRDFWQEMTSLLSVVGCRNSRAA